jgi:Luciferase-like monooxygenase
MKFGFVLPGGTAIQQLELAELADRHGWDGVFVWEAAYGIDAWSLLAAMAARTERVKLGTMLTPLPWRRPWKVASQVVTLDQLSNGRAVLAVGLGAIDNFLGNTGEELDRKTRAEMMDEGIDLIKGLWRGELTYVGKHYQMDLSGRTDIAETARPVQSNIPLWVVGAWPSEKSMTRVVRCDGLLPNLVGGGPGTVIEPDAVRDMLGWLRERGGAGPGFDFIVEGETDPDNAEQAMEKIGPLKEAGATWWLETRWGVFSKPKEGMEHVRDRIAAGPPTLD